MLSRKEFVEAGVLSGTDKITHHAYERFYANILAGFDGLGQIMEIGYGTGESIGFWQKLYPDASLIVLDKHTALIGEGFEVLKCDQSCGDQLLEIVNGVDNPDIGLIVDDGSHIPEHQMISFNILFEHLRPGGIYIIEDIECSYWKRGTCYGNKTEYGARSPKSFINKMLALPNWINREFLSVSEKVKLESGLNSIGFSSKVLKELSSVVFCHNCVAVFKGLEDDGKYAEREYRLKANTL